MAIQCHPIQVENKVARGFKTGHAITMPRRLSAEAIVVSPASQTFSHMKSLTANRLRKVLDYDRATGVFRWRMSLSNRVKIGEVAGCTGKDGYRQIRVDGHDYLASRLAWLYVHGCWPTNQIDHKNTIPGDDRFENLRDVTPAGNSQNRRRANQGNKTGLLGVTAHYGKYQARIRIDGKKRHLGVFNTPEEAHAAYVAAKREFHATCTI